MNEYLEATPGETPMPRICYILAELNDSGALTVKQLEDILDFAPRSGHPYMSRRVPDAEQLRRLFQHKAISRVAQASLLNYLTEGTSWIAEYIPDDLDVQGDRPVNTSAVIDHALSALAKASEVLTLARVAEKAGFAQLDPADASQIQSALNAILAPVLAARRTVELLTRATVPTR